jgi:hypothetical protein
MPQCLICGDVRVKEINRRLVMGGGIMATAREFGVSHWSVKTHRKKHLPWRNRLTKQPVTTDEKMEHLEYQFARLRVLASAGEKVGEELRVLVAQRNLLELQMRAEHRLGATHKRLFPPEMPEGEYEVEFVGGKPRGKTA